MLIGSTSRLATVREVDLRLVVKPTRKTNLKSESPKTALIQTKFAPQIHQIGRINQFDQFKERPQPPASFSQRLKISSSNYKSNSRRFRKLISNSTKLCAILLQISLLLPPPSRFHPNQCKSVVEAAPSQYVANLFNSQPDDLDLNDDIGPATTPSSRQSPAEEAPGKQSRGLIEYLQSLPISSVGLKHRALIECNPVEEMKKNSKFNLVWLKLVRNNNNTTRLQEAAAAADQNDITLLSLGERLVSPDKRFRVQHQPPSKWTLTIDNVNENDDKSYFLCQAAGGQTKGTSFLGGAQLNVLVPPKIVELESSPSLVQVGEFGQLRLQCKVISGQQSQISWRREDGQSLDGFEQRFRHHIEHRPPHQFVSVDSGELFSSSIRRNQAGAYLCIASNGIPPGVSQRISVHVANCRQSAELEAKSEPCGQLEPAYESIGSTTTTTTRRPHRLEEPSSGWSTLARQRAGATGRANASTGNSTSDQQQQPDKSRGSRYNHSHQQLRRRGPNQTYRERRPVRVESESCSSSSLPSGWQLLLATALGVVRSWAAIVPPPSPIGR